MLFSILPARKMYLISCPFFSLCLCEVCSVGWSGTLVFGFTPTDLSRAWFAAFCVSLIFADADAHSYKDLKIAVDADMEDGALPASRLEWDVNDIVVDTPKMPSR